jgi:hypothetical protein
VTAGEGRALLGLSVYADEVRLGTVGGVLVDDRADTVLGVDVDMSWGGGTRFLPWAAASVVAEGVRGNAFSFLGPEETDFYVRRGARRLSGDRVSTPRARG